MFRAGGVPVRGFVRGTVAAIAVLGIIAFASPTVASAGIAEEFEACSEVNRLLPLPDDETLVAAVTGDCAYLAPPQQTKTLLFRLKADGSVDPDFAGGGHRVVPRELGEPVRLLESDTSGYFLVTTHAVLKFTAAGTPNVAFGEGGVISDIGSVIPGAETITSAAQSAGMVTLVTTAGSQPLVARLDTNGSLDPAFAGDGVAEPVPPPELSAFALETSAVAIESNGRTVVIGGDPYGAIALRLLPDGSPDPAFGLFASGFARGPAYSASDSDLEIQAVYVGEDGAIRAYGRTLWIANDRVDSGFSARFGFTADGQPRTAHPVNLRGGYNNLVEIKNSGVAGTEIQFPPYGPLPPPWFTLTIFNYSEPVSFWDFDLPPRQLSSEESRATAMAYDAGDDKLIAGGYLVDPLGHNQLVIARRDGSTGTKDTSFGRNGLVLVPGNECHYGVAPPPAGQPELAWKRCRKRAPVIQNSWVKFKRSRSTRPGIEGTVRLRPPLFEHEFKTNNVQRLTIRLPKRLKLKRGSGEKIKVTALAKDPVTTSTSVKGRVLSVVMTGTNTWEGSGGHGESSPIFAGEGSLGLRFKVKAGALARIPRKLQQRPLNFGITAVITPLQYDYSTQEPSQFIGPNSLRTTAKARPVNARKAR